MKAKTKAKLFEVHIQRSAAKWDEPSPRATTNDQVLIIVLAAMQTPFLRIEIEDVSW